MVRAGTLPLRLLALSYGADTVWGEEIVDRRIIGAQRIENTLLGTIDYVSAGALAFRTCAAERGRIIFQIGTSDPSYALAAARTVERDVAAIDINMGCPKRFSLQGNMGAALLSCPALACDIVRAVATGVSVPVSAKIRLLESVSETVELAKQLEQAGAAALTVHARYRGTASQEPAMWEHIKPLVEASPVLPACHRSLL